MAKKGRHLIENGRIRKRQMVDGVKVAQDAQRPGRCTDQQIRHSTLFRTKTAVFPQQHHQRQQERHKVPEKAFLNKRQVTRQPHKGIHPRKAKRRQNNTDHALLPIG